MQALLQRSNPSRCQWSPRSSAAKAAHESWIADFAAAPRQSDSGAYVNFLGDEGEARVRAAYPGVTWDRLVAIKLVTTRLTFSTKVLIGGVVGDISIFMNSFITELNDGFQRLPDY